MSDPDDAVPTSNVAGGNGSSASDFSSLADSRMAALLASDSLPARSPSGHQGWQPPSVEQLQAQLPGYVVEQFVARGGMGAVYKAVQKSLDRVVAIKVLPPGIEDNDVQYAERFKQEAKAMARFRHPGIVSVYDAGETPDGMLYFVMEFIEGTDVAQRMAVSGKLPEKEALEIICRVCSALAYAHDRGVIHRDIKPSNIMIELDGTVKVADFGLAKTASMETGALTRSDLALGTPDFVAPEALIPGIKVDARVDVYAVGVMLYQMLTGRIPRGRFELPSGVVPGLDRRIDAVVDKAMQTDRERRYPSAIKLCEDLDRLVAASSSKTAAQKPRPGKIHFLLATVGATSLVLLGVSWWAVQGSAPTTHESVPSPSKSPPDVTSSTKAEAFWRSRWSKPGRLRASGTDMNGKPFDLTAAGPYEDFVQVMAVDPGRPASKPAWIALRANGDELSGDGRVEPGQLALLPSGYAGFNILAGGLMKGEIGLPAVPVLALSGERLSWLPGGPVVAAYADVQGVWHLDSAAFESSQTEKPDLTTPPKVIQVIVGGQGIGVLRSDGTLRIWHPQEMKLPDIIAREVKDVVDLGGEWAVLKNDGLVLTVNWGMKNNEFPAVPAVRESGKGGTAIVSGGYGLVVKRADGRWAIGSPGVVNDTLAKLHEENNESFSVFHGQGRSGILWIEPVTQIRSSLEKSAAKN